MSVPSHIGKSGSVSPLEGGDSSDSFSVSSDSKEARTDRSAQETFDKIQSELNIPRRDAIVHIQTDILRPDDPSKQAPLSRRTSLGDPADLEMGGELGLGDNIKPDQLDSVEVRMTPNEAPTKIRMEWPYFQDPVTGKMMRVRTSLNIPQIQQSRALNQMVQMSLRAMHSAEIPRELRKNICQIQFLPENKRLSLVSDSGMSLHLPCDECFDLLKNYDPSIRLDPNASTYEECEFAEAPEGMAHSLDEFLLQLNSDRDEWLAILDSGIEHHKKLLKQNPLRYKDRKKLQAYRLIRDLLVVQGQSYSQFVHPQFLGRARKALSSWWRANIDSEQRSIASKGTEYLLGANDATVLIGNLRKNLSQDLKHNTLNRYASSLKHTYSELSLHTHTMSIPQPRTQQTLSSLLTEKLNTNFLPTIPTENNPSVKLYASHTKVSDPQETADENGYPSLSLSISLDQRPICKVTAEEKVLISTELAPLEFSQTVSLTNTNTGANHDLVERFELVHIDCKQNCEGKGLQSFSFHKHQDKWYRIEKGTRTEVNWSEVQTNARFKAQSFQLKPCISQPYAIYSGVSSVQLPPRICEKFTIPEWPKDSCMKDLTDALRDYQKTQAENALKTRAGNTPLLDRYQDEIERFIILRTDSGKELHKAGLTITADSASDFFEGLKIKDDEEGRILNKEGITDKDSQLNKRYFSLADLHELAEAKGQPICVHYLKEGGPEIQEKEYLIPHSDSDAEAIHLYCADFRPDESSGSFFFIDLLPKNES